MSVEETARKIESLEIQGATAVAREAVKALQSFYSPDVSEDKLNDAAERLRSTRPTEPGLQNALDYVVETKDFSTALAHFNEAQAAIQDEGRTLVPEDGTVYTHCHSSTVRGVIEAAHETAAVTVTNTETRPVFQGRKTAKELAKKGIDVHHFVDSAVREALGMADVMMIGADAVTADGSVYNKIGSRLFSDTATSLDIPVYICTDSWKLAQDTVEVEQRSAEEVWEDAPAGVAVHNPAFDRVRPAVIDGIVTELGVLEPDQFAAAVRNEYPELF